MSLTDYYMVMHRLSSVHYTYNEINDMQPYERDIFMALAVEDSNKQQERNK